MKRQRGHDQIQAGGAKREAFFVDLSRRHTTRHHALHHAARQVSGLDGADLAAILQRLRQLASVCAEIEGAVEVM